MYVCVLLFNVTVIGNKETEKELCDETILPRQSKNVLWSVEHKGYN